MTLLAARGRTFSDALGEAGGIYTSPVYRIGPFARCEAADTTVDKREATLVVFLEFLREHAPYPGWINTSLRTPRQSGARPCTPNQACALSHLESFTPRPRVSCRFPRYSCLSPMWRRVCTRLPFTTTQHDHVGRQCAPLTFTEE